MGHASNDANEFTITNRFNEEQRMELNIYQKLAAARIEVQKKCTKKSGENKFAGFRYFTLDDFLSTATEELGKNGLTAIFNIDYKKMPTVESDRLESVQGLAYERAKLIITDGQNEIVFETPTADANVKGANDIQNLGSKHTYLKRYLYMNALELSEGDAVDATIGKDEEPKNARPATDAQIQLLKKLGIEIKDGITLQQASELIKEAKNARTN